MKKMRKIIERWRRALGVAPVGRVAAQNERGITLVEALMAFAVLAVGIVGLSTAMRRGLFNSVRAWDRAIKTNIAMSRLEEHKAQLFDSYVYNMKLPIVVPTVSAFSTPGVDFAGNTLTYTSVSKINLDTTTVSNATTVLGASYSVTFSTTPGVTPTPYYGAVASPTPYTGYNWVSPITRSACDQTAGNIYFNMITPPQVTGMVTLNFVDYLNSKREEVLWMNGLQRKVFSSGTMSLTPTAPTPVTIPITAFDTDDASHAGYGQLSFRVQQTGTTNEPNNWGDMLDDGNVVNLASVVACTGCAAASFCQPTPTGLLGTCCALGGSHGTIGCDSDSSARVAFARAPSAAALAVTWSSSLSDILKVAGTLSSYFYLPTASQSVTLSVATRNASGTAVTYLANSVGGAGWKQMTTASISAGSTITNLYFDVRGITNAAPVTMALDSVFTTYTAPLNPNAVIQSADLSVLDSYKDTVSYQDYDVESYVVPLTNALNSNGYQIQVIVHNMVKGVVNDRFPPVTITNTVSP